MESEKERKERRENDAATKWLWRLGDGQRKISKTGEDGRYRRAQVLALFILPNNLTLKLLIVSHLKKKHYQ